MTLKKNNSKSINEAQLIFQEGVTLLQQGKFCDADRMLEEAHQLNPNNVDVLNLMGIRFYQKQDYPRALDFLNRANQLTPGSPQTLGNIGLILNALSEFSEALHFLDQAILNNPNIPELHNNRGNALKGLQQNMEAIAAYTKAITLRPNYAEALNNKGVLLLESGETDEAISFFELAIKANSNFATAFNNLGNALTHIKKFQEAFQCYERALKINPHYLDALLNFGGSLKESKQFYAAIECYQYALTLDVDKAKTYYLLGEIFYDIGDTFVAKTHYEKSIELDPTSLEAHLALTIAQIPKAYISQQEYSESRVFFKQQVELLSEKLHLECSADLSAKLISKHPFYLAYQDHNNQSLLIELGRISAFLAQSIQKTIAQAQITNNKNGKIRLGIVSGFFCNHPVWHAITKGWVGRLDSQILEIILFNTSGAKDAETQWAKSKAAQYFNCGSNVTNAANFISNQNVDVLLYPELGMDPTSKALACLRLAPTQAVSWGHPETTGLPSIDFFLSGELLEPNQANHFYTEKLVRLPNLGTHFEHQNLTIIKPSLSNLGIDKNLPILLCAGSPSKYSPSNDQVFVSIARKLGQCQFIFFNFEENTTEILKERLYKSFTLANLNPDEFIRFIPFLKKGEFYGLMYEAAIYLDTIGFSGFNTAMQAITCNLPIVTLEGNWMRGRFGSAILDRLGMKSWVCNDQEEYINLACQLIQNKDLLHSYKAEITKNQMLLFNDLEPITALEEFLVDQVNRVRHLG